ncbi:uncharacterized protein LOC110459748 [Mizuhopecten yessoensis]|uniref:Uncharacterized protein n=1 Tax=Mizuhopecten yessoensis TaxID=6573 RepID=A0A210R3D0_MIZYE|nr:uncharacterized protein LOC110459748 [Mizuhopecten yessoensis]OWF55499.1 hypothetical protein KP79_PYT19548 [Mizuhopecten yessoensis]
MMSACSSSMSDVPRYQVGRSDSSASSLSMFPFGFDSKTKYDANESLITIRSTNFSKKELEKDDDIWKRPPPDFRPQKFAPNPPKRNSRESMQPWRYGTFPGEHVFVKKPSTKVMPKILMPKKTPEGRIITQFHIDRPFTAKKKFVREGMFKPEMFVNPTEHDFRGYPPIKKMGLPEFTTHEEADPFDIYFNTDRLNIIHGEPLERAADRNIKGLQMAPPVHLLPRWERQLILDNEPYPTKPGEFNRHRLRFRPARSAFMERVTRTLDINWAKERLDMALEQVSS